MTKSTKFNLFRYFELLKKVESVSKEDYFLDPKVLQLLSYESTVYDQIYYNQKTKYMDFIQKYLGKAISAAQFRREFLQMKSNDAEKGVKMLKNFEKLSVFWVEPGSGELSPLLIEIYDWCLTIIEILQHFEEFFVFWTQPGSVEFSSLLADIDDWCLTIVEFGTGEEGISEDLFQNLIQKTFIKMKDL